MPIYEYSCPKHGNFEVVNTYHNVQQKEKCPAKRCKKLCFRDYQSENVTGFVKLSNNQVKTLRHLADRNRDSLKKEKEFELYKKHNDYRFKEPEEGPFEVKKKDVEKSFKNLEKRNKEKEFKRKILKDKELTKRVLANPVEKIKTNKIKGRK